MNKKFILLSICWFLISCFGLFSENNSQEMSWLEQIIYVLHLNYLPIDKLAHFLMFYLQTLFCLHSFEHINNSRISILLFILVFWAGLSEYLQLVLTQTRSAELLDFTADICGIIFSLLFFSYANYLEQKNTATQE